IRIRLHSSRRERSRLPFGCNLSEKYSVLVLERGNVLEAYPNVLHDKGIFANVYQEDDGDTPAHRFTSEDGVPNVRGRVLGGTSMIHSGFYSRAEEEFFR
ncbi:PREDICTED: (R)-mandelonitrile lyase, partial [Prunus dulcis]